MPNRRTHTAVGAPSGLACSVFTSLGQDFPDFITECFGGLCGGWTGAALPDIIDPPNHPGHRSLGHGLVPVGAGLVFWAENLGSWQDSLRRLANEHQMQQITAQDPLASLGHLLAELFFRFLAGFLAGLGAGYYSHIILDHGTPRCIPFVA